MTWLKLAIIKTIIVIGSIVILIAQWHDSMKESQFGNDSFNQGEIGAIFLAVVMSGIPIVVFAVATYLVLSFLLFGRGELEEYQAKKLLKKMSDELPPKPTARQGSEPPSHDYAD